MDGSDSLADNEDLSMNKGWECPVCGRGLAPWVMECPCYSEPKITQKKELTKEEEEELLDKLADWSCSTVTRRET